MLALLLALPLLVFRGNVTLVEDVYRSVLELPAGTKATPANARSVAVKLRRFLHSAGYTLATVRAHVEGEQILIDVDEGRLDKIIFLGGGAFETLRLRLDLQIKDDVFNKSELERQLRRLASRLGLAEFAYDVVPVRNVEPPKVQLDEIEPFEELSLGLVRPGRPYELHILVQPGVFRPGISPELEVNSLEGGGLGATYHTGRLIWRDDRLNLGGRVAGQLRQRLNQGSSYFTFSRARGEAEYDARPLLGVLRPSIRARADLSDRQRPDLNLESFKFATLEAGLQLVLVPGTHVRATLGAGQERRLLFSTQAGTGLALIAGPQYALAQNRLYSEARLELVFDPQSLRRDRHHRLELGARIYGRPRPGDENALHLGGGYQKAWLRGWDEIWLQAHAFWRTGYVVFPEEQSVGDSDFLGGPFGAVYSRKLVGLNLEYRLSLVRDILKLGLFHNAVGYADIVRRNPYAEKRSFADALGLGVHALMIDEFQLDAYFGVGWSTEGGRFDKGAALAIHQAF